MEPAVAGQRVAAERPGGAVERGERATRLPDDDVERGHVVELELRLGGEVDGALRDEHVGPEVAVGPGAPAAPRQRHERVEPVVLVPAGERRVGQRRVVEPGHVGDVALRGPQQRLAGPGAAVLGGPPAALQLRGADHPDHHLVVDHQRDQRGPDGHPADEVLGAVDRVDHPAPLAVTGRAHLLAEHRVARPGPRQRATDALLDRLVGVGHRREVGLVDHVQVQRLEPIGGQRVGVVREDVREPQVVGEGRGHDPQVRPRGALSRQAGPSLRASQESSVEASTCGRHPLACGTWRSPDCPCTRWSCTPPWCSSR